MPLPPKTLREARDHVEEHPRQHSDEDAQHEAMVGNAHADTTRGSDFDPRHPYEGDPGEPLGNPPTPWSK